MRVAIAQARPVYYDLEGTLQKTESLVAEAVRRGAAMVAFPETWLPGYPAWLDCCRDIALWDHAPTKKLFARLSHESIVIPGPVVTRLEDLAEAHDVVLVIGANERVATGQAHGTLYNTVLTIDPEAGLVHVHRKIMPTHTERMVWGMGDGGSLRVATTRDRYRESFITISRFGATNVGMRGCEVGGGGKGARHLHIAGRPCTAASRKQVPGTVSTVMR